MKSGRAKGPPAFHLFELNNVNHAARHSSAVEIGLARATEFHHTVNSREERVIDAHADVFAGHDFCSPLADDDLAYGDLLTVGALHAEVFGVGISEVFGCSACFCMCHIGLITYTIGAWASYKICGLKSSGS